MASARSSRRATFSLAATLAALVAGCATAEQGTVEGERARVQVLIGEDRVEVLMAREIAAPLDGPWDDVDGGTLRWEFEAQGQVIATGRMLDPRLAELETHGEPGADGGEFVAGSGTLSLDIPNQHGLLRVFDANDNWIGETDHIPVTSGTDPDIEVKADIDFDTDIVGGPVVVAGPETSRRDGFTILMLPEGFTEAQMGNFHAAVARASDAMRADVGLANYSNRLTILRQDILSKDAGLTDPAEGVQKDTAFNITFGDDIRVPRRCTMPSTRWDATSARNLTYFANSTHADLIVIVTNTNEWSGCARPDRDFVTTHIGLGMEQVLIHEIGHVLFDLADEYSGGTPGYACGTGPNLSRSATDLPWADLVASTTPLPTTPGSVEQGTVGAFEGGGYCETGVYRPEHNCKMREAHVDFCSVCQRVIDDKFAARETVVREVEIRNRRSQPIWVMCDGATSSTCSGWTYLRPGKKESLKVRDGRVRLDGVGVFEVPGAEVSLYDNAANPFAPAE